jgi:cytochrome c oxidase subunit 3
MTALTSTLADYRHQLRNNRLGLWLFFVSEAFLFGGLLVARFTCGHTRPDLTRVGPDASPRCC